MRTTVYPNTENFVMSNRNKPSFSAVDNETLQLSDDDRIEITQIFLRQIPLCCLTPRCAKVAMVVFSQTIDFNKFEDDMNGRRLQQLTNLFPHHANEVVRYLEAIHVLICRKGHYGKYLSINFNFSQWGKEKCDDVITNDPTIMLDKARFMAYNFPERPELSEKLEETKSNPAPSLSEENTPYTNTLPDYSEDLLKDVLTAVGQIKVNVNGLSEKQDLITKASDQQQAEYEKAINQQQAMFKKAFTQQQAEYEKASGQQQAAFEKAFVQQQANVEQTVKHLLKKALATANQAKQHTEETASENKVTPLPTITTKPASEPVIEVVIEPETDKPQIEKYQSHQEMTAPLPNNVPTEALIFPAKLSHDQRYDAKKLLQRADSDMQQVLLDMLSKRMLNTSNPVNSPIAYLTNLLIRLANNRLDIPFSAMPSIIGSVGTGSIAAPEIPPLRDSERRRAEYQEAVADCIQMEKNIKLMGRNDSLTFSEALDKFDMRGLWSSICERFTETKEALAAIQSLNGMPV